MKKPGPLASAGDVTVRECSGPDAWGRAMHLYRLGSASALAGMLHTADAIPQDVRHFLAEIVLRAPRERGRPPLQSGGLMLNANARKALAAHKTFSSALQQGLTKAEALLEVQEKHAMSERTARRFLGQRDRDAAAKK